jgi:hypothetical protein
LKKLNNNNYDAWAFKAQLLLEQKKVWKVIKTPRPAVEADDKNVQELAEWDVANAEAKFIIGNNVEDNQVVYLRKFTTAKEYWEALKEIHHRPTLGQRIRTITNIFWKRQPQGGNMHDHVAKIIAWIDKLQVLGKKMDDGLAVGAILESVGPENLPLR